MKKICLLSIIFVLAVSACSYSGDNGNLNSEGVKPVEEKATVNDKGKETSKPLAKDSDRKVLDLSGKGLSKIDTSVFDRVDLTELDVSDNKLGGALPAEIRQLKNLRVLRASNNNKTGVPAEIGQLEQLEILDLSDNQLTGLPNELANLKNLKTLNLSGNKYSEQDLSIIRNSLPNVDFILN